MSSPRSVLRWLAVSSLLLSLPLAEADDKAKTQAKSKKRAPNPAFRPIEDVPGLPRVLLIGDSISIGYTVAVREELKGKANEAYGERNHYLSSMNRYLSDGPRVRDSPRLAQKAKRLAEEARVRAVDYENAASRTRCTCGRC